MDNSWTPSQDYIQGFIKGYFSGIGKKGGRKRSLAKAKAARLNARKANAARWKKPQPKVK